MEQNPSQERPNPAANEEPAEGSRETVPDDQGQQSGITNRPIDEERQEQQEVPPRGQTKEEAGRTAGGGNPGHDQPADVRRETPTRNAGGTDEEPVMPQD